MPKVVMNIRYVGMKNIISVSDHEKNRTPDGSSAIDPARSHLNRVLLGPKTQAEALKKLWADGVKKPATQSETPYIQLVLGASPEYFRDESQGAGEWNNAKTKEWVKRTRDWLRDEYGPDCVHISMHLDEDTPHIHALIVPTYEKKPRKPGRQKRGETLDDFQTRKRAAENALPIRSVGRSSNEKWRKNYARHDARKSYHRAVELLGIEYGQDFLAQQQPSPTHKQTGTWVKEQSAKLLEKERFLNEAENVLKKREEALKKERRKAQKVLSGLVAAYEKFRDIIPQVRKILQWEAAPEHEKTQAKEKRREIVAINPMLRRIIKEQSVEVASLGRLTIEQPREEPNGPSF
jgi:hypothetical protein